MKFKKSLSLILAVILMLGMFAGCSVGNKSPEESTNSSGDNTTQLPVHGNTSTVTISDLKLKYGESDAGKLLPLYNLDPNEPLAISVKYTPSDERALFSIHTDEKCLEASEVALMWSPSDYNPSGPKTYEVKPIMAPLSNSSTEGLWGNVSTYYIKFNYDINAETETKLDEPVVVSMSIKSPTAIPNVSYEVKDGNFELKWTAVEGATSYKIYQRQVITLLETTNIAPKGKEEAYSGTFPLLVKEVDANTTSFTDWMDDGKNGQSKLASEDTIGGYIVSYQNQGVNGEYYVTAVVNGKESLFSMGVSTSGLPLPKGFAHGTSLLANSYDSANDLPKTVNIEYADGSVKSHNVSYETKSGTNSVTYRVDGTSIVGYVTVKSGENVKTEKSPASGTGGFIEAENNIPQNAPTDMPTVSDTTASNDPEEQEKTIVEQQIENTERVLEEANKETVQVTDGVVIEASSALEEYLARSMMAGKGAVSLAAFPEAQNCSILTDVLCKVVYQNPLILGVSGYGYDYESMTLLLVYDYTVEEIVQRQEEIMKEGQKIINEIISSGMSDSAKRRAIYNYLEENTTYDDATLASAEENNYKDVDNKYRDSFSTYGILVKKTGVCQSYAYAFDYLCELAGLDCIIVTGDIFGYLPHAWNKVKIDNEWYVIDVTNNEKSLGIKDFMYENPDKISTALGYFEDDLYYTENETGKYVSSSTQYSKYKDCTIESLSALEEYIKQNAKANAEVEFIAVYKDFDSDDVIAALRKANIVEIGNSMIICGYVWFEVVR